MEQVETTRQRHRRWPHGRGRLAWLLLVLSAAVLAVGVSISNGFVLAAGLVLAGVAVQLLGGQPPRGG